VVVEDISCRLLNLSRVYFPSEERASLSATSTAYFGHFLTERPTLLEHTFLNLVKISVIPA
jgi:hypothetical protein